MYYNFSLQNLIPSYAISDNKNEILEVDLVSRDNYCSGEIKASKFDRMVLGSLDLKHEGLLVYILILIQNLCFSRNIKKILGMIVSAWFL